MTATASLRGVLLAILAFAIFSTHDAIIKSLGSTYSVVQIMFFATLFGFPPMALEMSAERAVENFRPNNPLALIARTVLMLLSMSLVFYAFTVVPMAQVYAILFSTPLLVTILAVPLLGEEVRLRRWIAVIVGLIGVLIVVRPGGTELTLGHLAALIGAVSNSFGVIILRRIGRTERSAVLILYPMATVLVVMAFFLPGTYQPMPLTDLSLMAGIGLLAFAGQMMNITAYKLAPAGIVAPMQYSQIVWAAVFGALFFDEVPDFWTGVGAAVVIASGIYIVWRETVKKASETRPVTRMGNPRLDAGASADPKGKRFDAAPGT